MGVIKISSFHSYSDALYTSIASGLVGIKNVSFLLFYNFIAALVESGGR